MGLQEKNNSKKKSSPQPAVMGTKVIDKLRIQGSAASLRDPVFRQPAERPAVDISHIAKHFTFHQDGDGNSKNRRHLNTPNISHPNSAPSRKQSFMQRVQEANRGLTSHEKPQYSNDYTFQRTSFNFMLRGKPVNGDLDLSTSPHKRVGHYKTSTTEAYRARHRFRDMTDFYDESSFHSLPATSNNEFFYLGPQASPAPNALNPSRRIPPAFLPQSAPAFVLGQSSISAVEKDPMKDVHDISDNNSKGHENKSIVSDGGFEYANFEDNKKREIMVDGEYPNLKPHPHPHPYPHPTPHPTPVTVRRKHPSTKTKTSLTESSMSPPDLNLLNQCLHVQQSHQLDPDDVTEDEHPFKKGFCDKLNPTFPARQSSTKKMNKKGLGAKDNRYFFHSVESYVHFNKIYPQVQSNPSITGNELSSKSRPGPHVPQIDGFSPHCTDTLLLKMMFEMNKPARSVKSVSKYSDVAVHKDLDEFMIVGTPSVSRSISVNSLGLGQGGATQTTLKTPDNPPEATI